MSKASTGFAFVAGLTIGAAGAWYYLKDKYAKLAEEEDCLGQSSIRQARETDNGRKNCLGGKCCQAHG